MDDSINALYERRLAAITALRKAHLLTLRTAGEEDALRAGIDSWIEWRRKKGVS